MFAFTLAAKLLAHTGGIHPAAWRFLLAGPAISEATKPNPAPEWLTDKSWTEVSYLATLPGFEGFDDHFAGEVGHYRKVFDAHDAHKMGFAGEWEGRFDTF